MSDITVNSHFKINNEEQKKEQFNILTLRMVNSLMKSYVIKHNDEFGNTQKHSEHTQYIK